MANTLSTNDEIKIINIKKPGIKVLKIKIGVPIVSGEQTSLTDVVINEKVNNYIENNTEQFTVQWGSTNW